ncbi:hypothetical protein DRQ29_03970 [bacterium]|nr:MAG: hypothetical protein DRQ29_03970 [bacterium]
MEIIPLKFPDGDNIIFGQTHFIKSVEDIHEAMVNCNANAKFGLAFSEASGAKLVRTSGTDDELIDIAAENIFKLGCGHSFLIIIRDSFPINYLPRIKDLPEVLNIYCATANPVQVIVARTELGGAVLGVVDGEPPVAIEDDAGKKWRYEFLRKIGYKF